MDKPLTKGQLKYFEEYEKYKHILIEPGSYHIKNNVSVKYNVTSIDLEKELVTISNVGSGFSQTKTLHWARKNLIKIPE